MGRWVSGRPLTFQKQKSGRGRRRLAALVNQQFQWRYTWYLISTIVLATLFTGGITAYLLNQNYGIFNRLAFLHAPDLLPQLEREQVWINTFLVAFFFGLVTFNLVFGLRMTSRIAGPLMILKRHIRSLTQGRFFSQPLRVRESDEFHDLIKAYNYLYLSLQAQIRRDSQKLEKAMEEPDPKKIRALLVEILEMKKRQITDPRAEPVATGDSHHAS